MCGREELEEVNARVEGVGDGGDCGGGESAWPWEIGWATLT